LSNPTNEFDGPWKAAIEEYLPDFFAFFFPVAYADIDWSRGYAFLDNELQQVVRDAEIGLLRLDRLVEVCRADGTDAWVLVHVELQNDPETKFARRMCLYNNRLYDRYDRDVASLGVLGDEQLSWRPTTFRRALWGCYEEFGFPIVKLADWRANIGVLEANDNPFATVVLAHLAAQDTRHKVRERQIAKLALVRRLYERGYNRERILSLFRFIDWLLALPDAAQQAVWRDIAQFEEEQQVTYITSVERIGIEKGREEGLQLGREEGLQLGREEEAQRALRRVLERRFGAAAAGLLEQVEGIRDVSKLEALLDQAITAGTPDEVQALFT
jgi:hypothetical protein